MFEEHTDSQEKEELVVQTDALERQVSLSLLFQTVLILTAASCQSLFLGHFHCSKSSAMTLTACFGHEEQGHNHDFHQQRLWFLK